MKLSTIFGAAFATAVSVLPVAAHAQRDPNQNTAFSQYWFSKPVPLPGNMMEVLNKQPQGTYFKSIRKDEDEDTVATLSRADGNIIICKFHEMEAPQDATCIEKYENTSPEYAKLPARYK